MVLLLRGDDIDYAKRDAGCTGGQDQEILELAQRIRCRCSCTGCEGFEVRQSVLRELRRPARTVLGVYGANCRKAG